jgi:HAD superfamily hydrolase (TIGR01509 family)
VSALANHVSSATGAAAVLFDLDGLLVDSEPVWYEVESAAVERLGGVWTRADQEACLGGTMAASARYMFDQTGHTGSVAEFSAGLTAEMVERFRRDLPVQPGAIGLLDALRQRAVPIGLVSSSYRSLIDAALEGLGTDRFAVTVAGDEVTRGKPDPEPYLTACRLLGVEPARTIVLEDATNGIVAAEAAGCTVVVVPSISPITAGPRRHVVSSLTEIDPEWLLGLTA